MNITSMKEFAKKVLAIPWVRKTRIVLQSNLHKMLSLSKLFAVPYYLIFSRKFDREIFAFTHAVRQYNADIRRVLPSNIVIRRNIHRLEKGLIMENRRSIFALDYIEETIEAYQKMLTSPDHPHLEMGELQWAHDVLTQYFSVTDDSQPLIGRMKAVFEALPVPAGLNASKQATPYTHKTLKNIEIPSYEQFMALSRRRRSVRWFKDEKVPRELVDKAILAASQAPSACNRQPFSYRIFDDPQMVAEIGQIPFGTAGFAHNFPMVIVVVGDMSKFFAARDRHVIYIDSSLSIMAFLYALETLGLNSLTINCQDFSIIENRLKKALGLKPFERPILMLAVGYGQEDGMIPYSQKKPLEALRTYNQRGDQS
jgi:nitroreductase